MGASVTFLVLGSLSTLFLTFLFVVEDRRGVRFGERVRGIFDRMILGIQAGVRNSFPEVNDHFFQELFYFVVHKVLSFVLTLLRKLEHVVLHIVRFNRMQVMRLRRPEHSATSGGVSDQLPNHLADIAEHKRAVELSHTEKSKRKEASIEGSGPF
ncbi:MAG: hypothetical protein RLZZ234_722 [Candidatus Parcubacteria bacterium]